MAYSRNEGSYQTPGKEIVPLISAEPGMVFHF